jgi:hypothetical protein
MSLPETSSVILVARDIDTNLLAIDIRKWNVMDAMWGVAEAWESITSSVIQNCFAKCC